MLWVKDDGDRRRTVALGMELSMLALPNGAGAGGHDSDGSGVGNVNNTIANIYVHTPRLIVIIESLSHGLDPIGN